MSSLNCQPFVIKNNSIREEEDIRGSQNEKNIETNFAFLPALLGATSVIATISADKRKCNLYLF